MSLSNINPVKRLEYFLQNIADGKTTATKTPVRRIEEFLRRIARKNASQDEEIDALEERVDALEEYGSSTNNYQPSLTLNGNYIVSYSILYNRRIAIITLEVSLPAGYEIPTDGLVLASYDRTTEGAPLYAASRSTCPIGDTSGAYILTAEGWPYKNELKLRRRNFDNRIVSGGSYFVTIPVFKE